MTALATDGEVCRHGVDGVCGEVILGRMRVVAAVLGGGDWHSGLMLATPRVVLDTSNLKFDG